jgi:hypothetical protein
MVRHFLSPVVTKAVAGFVVGCALLVLPAMARAQTTTAPPPPPPAAAPAGALGQGFGEAGQLVISSEDFIGFAKVNHAGWSFTVQPAIDYFLMPAVTIGGVAAYIQKNGGYKEELVGARAGFNLNVTENIGAWGKVGIAYDHASQGNFSSSTTWITAYLPIMYHLMPHLFIGVGPYYNLKIAGDGDHGYGFSSLVGGWF